MKLNLGCGYDLKEGYINVDYRQPCDIEWDLNVFPYPFEENSVDEIIMWRILEHLDDVSKVLEELYHILKIGGVIKIRVPYANSPNMWRDFTHKHFFTLDSFNDVDIDRRKNGYNQSDCRFEIRKKIIPSGFGKIFISKKLAYFVSFFIGNIVSALEFELVKR